MTNLTSYFPYQTPSDIQSWNSLQKYICSVIIKISSSNHCMNGAENVQAQKQSQTWKQIYNMTYFTLKEYNNIRPIVPTSPSTGCMAKQNPETPYTRATKLRIHLKSESDNFHQSNWYFQTINSTLITREQRSPHHTA